MSFPLFLIVYFITVKHCLAINYGYFVTFSDNESVICQFIKSAVK